MRQLELDIRDLGGRESPSNPGHSPRGESIFKAERGDCFVTAEGGGDGEGTFAPRNDTVKQGTRIVGGVSAGKGDEYNPLAPFAKGESQSLFGAEAESSTPLTPAPSPRGERGEFIFGATPEEGRSRAAVLRELLRGQWPEAGYVDQFDPRTCFRINLESLGGVFPKSGIPYGQILEITGGVSSGKTGLLLRTLAALTPTPRLVYVDGTGTFFPPAAAAAEIDPRQILLLRPERIGEAIRGVELLLEAKLVNCAVFDLAGGREVLPRIMLHRLRRQITRAKALGIFLTEAGVHLLPASFVSLQLTVHKLDRHTLEVTATRSRINNEGAKGRLRLEAA